jgi:hypothetical protein
MIELLKDIGRGLCLIGVACVIAFVLVILVSLNLCHPPNTVTPITVAIAIANITTVLTFALCIGKHI